ncbi:Acg family FMN-binding oxidoreductase [Nocardioides sp. Root151]|uniref:Acg family FMN-binding oxidoreductase n=1 Tax=Nocardioides sp. Root151 TaxID=1736475 RepID=UPI000A4A8452|nr:nitroreductase family protein [Nocardioides sp. Root151]
MTGDGAAKTKVVPARILRDIVGHACMAPSVHNTQPWSWHASGNTLELFADTGRQLTVADTRGRNLVISCGAALHHAQVAARALGWEPTVTRLPDGDGSTLLARIRLTPATPPPDAAEALQAIRDRCTDRRRFTSWPVPEERLRHLAATADEWGAHVMVVQDLAEKLRTELLVGRALDRQATDEPLAEEQRQWVNHSARDGVPGVVIPANAPNDTHLRTRFGSGLLTEPERELEGADGLLVMRGASDDSPAWLRTGEGLSALWLRATREGLSVVPLSQVIEVDETRERLRAEVLHGMGTPHLLVRVGWQAISRGALPRTPRRPLDDVLSW